MKELWSAVDSYSLHQRYDTNLCLFKNTEHITAAVTSSKSCSLSFRHELSSLCSQTRQRLVISAERQWKKLNGNPLNANITDSGSAQLYKLEMYAFNITIKRKCKSENEFIKQIKNTDLWRRNKIEFLLKIEDQKNSWWIFFTTKLFPFSLWK